VCLASGFEKLVRSGTPDIRAILPLASILSEVLDERRCEAAIDSIWGAKDSARADFVAKIERRRLMNGSKLTESK